MSHDADDPIVIRPGEGALVHGMNMVHKVDAGRLAGGLMIMEGEIAAGGLIPPHTHSREDECSYVVAGEVMFQVGDEVVTATPGSYVIKPRGVPHAIWNSGGEPARLMEIHVPATFDRFYDELGATMADASMSEQERREAQEALHARYGLTFHWDRIPQLMQRYGVRPSAVDDGDTARQNSQADRPRLQFGLQFTTVRRRPGKADQRALVQLDGRGPSC